MIVLLLSLSPVLMGPGLSPAPTVLEPRPLVGQEVDSSTAEIERHDEWPEPVSSEAVRTSLAKVRKRATKEMERQGLAELAAIGPAAAPFLLRALGKERDDDTARVLVEALDGVTTVEYTRALAESFDDRKAAVRNYALERAAVLGDPGLGKVAGEIWKDLEERLADERERERVDEGTVRAAALLAFSCGHVAAVPAVIERAGSKAYGAHRDALGAAAGHAGANAPEIADALAVSLAEGRPMSERLGALRLLTHAGSKEQSRAIAAALDARENPVKIAAINALRRIVDGEPPIEKMSAFDAIERAKKWKSRL